MIFHFNEKNYPILLIPSFSLDLHETFIPRKGKIFAENERWKGNWQTLNDKKKEKRRKKEQTRGKTSERNIRIFIRTILPTLFHYLECSKHYHNAQEKNQKPRESWGEYNGGDISLSQHHL